MRKVTRIFLGLVAVFVASPAFAQTDSDLSLLFKSSSVAPNIMVLVDNSTSMGQVLWSTSFDPNVFYPTVCNIPAVVSVLGSEGYCPLSQDPNGLNRCPKNDTNQADSSAATQGSVDSSFLVQCSKNLQPNLCTLAPAGFACAIHGQNAEFTLPDYVSGGGGVRTLWSKNYLNWIFAQVTAGSTPVLPTVDRIGAVKTAILNAIDPSGPYSRGAWNAKARFGMARFNGNSEGAAVDAPINGSSSFNQYQTKISGLTASTASPLAEALVEIAFYMSGNDMIGASADLASAQVSNSNPMDAAACAKNYVILLSDGTSEQDEFTYSRVSGKFQTAIGDYDHDGYDPNHRPGVPPYENQGTDWLDDVAKYLFDKDLRPLGLKNNKTLAGTQNITTYVVGFFAASSLLQDTARKGDGKYFLATSSAELGQAINDAIDDIISRNASFSAASIPSTRTANNEALFTAFFEPSSTSVFYRGHLEAYQIGPNFDILGKDGNLVVDPTDGEFFEPRSNYFWDAGVRLSDANDPFFVATRKLYYNPTTLGDPNVFNAANITAAKLGVTSSEVSLYPKNPATGLAYTSGQTENLADALVNYVRGEDAFDADGNHNTTERRNTVLGDIFHANPLAVGGVPFFHAEEPGFGPIGDPNGPSFFDMYYARSRVLYAGANDGMLHAFDAGAFLNPDGKPTSGDEGYQLGSGQEIFGYVANASLPTLKNLVKTGATKPFFMDGSPAAADAWIPSNASDVSKTAGEWATVLVSGMRNGGSSVLAFDITDPNATNGTHGPYPKLLWEFSDPNGPLGRTWSTPVVTRVKIKAGVTGDFCGDSNGDGADLSSPTGNCRETWVAIFAGGYQEQGDPAQSQFIGNPSQAGWSAQSRSIYIVELATGKILARASYTLGDPQLQYMTYAIPSAPAVADFNFDGFADLIYVGDAGGQLWKWDISAVAQPDATGRVDTSQWPIGRFFVAPAGSNGHRRQIFYPPSLSLVNDRLTVSFGTGERTDLKFNGTVGVDDNQFYVIRDDHATGLGAIPGIPFGPSSLTLLGATDNSDTNLGDLGFYVVAADDEKFVTEAVAFGGFVVVLGYNPDLNGSIAPCEGGGSSNLHIFSLSDGTGYFPQNGPGEPSRWLRIGSGLPTSPRISQFGNTANIVVQTSTGRLLTPGGPASSSAPIELLYWRQD